MSVSAFLQQQIEGFPTLYLFHNGQKMSEHKGERDLETLRKFVVDQVPHDELWISPDNSDL